MSSKIEKWFPETKLKMLSGEEQNEIALKAKKWDVEARNKLIEHNMGLIVSIAKKYARWDIDIQDLIQEWVIWLMRWINKYSPKYWVKFSFYITYWVEAAIVKYLKKNNIIRFPFSSSSIIYKIISIISENNWKVDIKDLCKKLNLSEEKLNEFLLSIGCANLMSLDKFLIDEEKRTLLSIIEDTTVSVEYTLVEQDRKKIVKNIVEKLPDKRKYVILKRFWLNWENNHTLQEIWNSLWVSRERIRQIEKVSLKELKKILINEGIKREDVL